MKTKRQYDSTSPTHDDQFGRSTSAVTMHNGNKKLRT